MAIPDDYLATSKPEPLEAVAARLRDGDLLLCSARDPFSRLIGWATKSPWTHVALAQRWPQLGRILVFEAVQSLGVRAIPIERFIAESSTGRRPYPGRIVLARHDELYRRCEAGGAALQRLADFSIGRLGDRFAPGEIVKIGVRIVLGRLNFRLPETMGPKDEFICSEYVARCFDAIGIPPPWDGLGFIAPSDFASAPETRAMAEIKTR